MKLIRILESTDNRHIGNTVESELVPGSRILFDDGFQMSISIIKRLGEKAYLLSSSNYIVRVEIM